MQKQILSAANLVKNSCKQLFYFRNHERKKFKFAQDGIKYQDKIVNYFGGEEEMVGNFSTKDFLIFFSNDCVCKDKVIEIKKPYIGMKDAYEKNSLIQTALYCSLIRLGSTKLKRAKFSNKCNIEIVVNKKIPYYLYFSENLIRVEPKNPQKIVDFYIKKAYCSMEWESAKDWDYRNNDAFPILKKYINEYRENYTFPISRITNRI